MENKRCKTTNDGRIDEMKLIDDAYQFVRSKNIANKGECIEASVNMHNYLSKRGVRTWLKRYVMPGGDGHWTIVTRMGEFDPTIAEWGEKAPEDSEPGYLYEVTKDSPHANWEVDKDVDMRTAYENVIMEEDERIEDASSKVEKNRQMIVDYFKSKGYEMDRYGHLKKKVGEKEYRVKLQDISFRYEFGLRYAGTLEWKRIAGGYYSDYEIVDDKLVRKKK